MTRYRILPPAEEELRNASRWYEEQREGLGHALLDEFEEQGLPIRRHRLRRFARYSILMFVDEDGTPTVLAFSHSSRDPEHWKDRIR